MNEALNILQKFSLLHESAYGFNGKLIASLGDINSAIIELKTPKACDGCKWLPDEDEYGMTLCNHRYACIRQESEDYYEPKDI